MKTHWGFLVLVAIIFYFIGSWMPGLGKKVYSQFGM
jgi:hypothetical protein